MGTKTDDATGAKAATGAKDADRTEDVTGTGKGTPEAETPATTEAAAAETTEPVGTTKAGEPTGAVPHADGEVDEDAAEADDAYAATGRAARSTGVGQGAAAVVSAALGVIGLSGGWLGTIAGARSNIMGQLETKQSASVSDQLQAMYGDSWQATALIAGVFAVSALIVGFVVLVRPAFGAPGKEQAPWIKSVAWAGVALGVIGLILAVAKYSDLLLGLPSAPS